MRVKKLMEFLSSCPARAIVVLSKDSEGNRFSPLAECGIGAYIPENERYGDFINNEDRDTGDGSIAAIVLWPTN